jgi:hypothetical protein
MPFFIEPRNQRFSLKVFYHRISSAKVWQDQTIDFAKKKVLERLNLCKVLYQAKNKYNV